MLKKLLTGIIIAVLVLGWLYGYFLYAGDPNMLRNWIANNRQYTAIFLISIIMLVCLRGTGKLSKPISFAIILINIYLLGDLFFRNNIGLDSRQFITLFGLIVVALATTYITHRVRYICMWIIGLGIAFVLVTGTLPMYETIPSIGDFIASQKTKIINKWTDQWILTIKTALGTKQIPLSELSESDLNLQETTQISFSSKIASQKEKLFIALGNGSFININPQSAITLQQSWGQTTMQILQGDVEYYLPAELSGTLHLIGTYKGKSIQNIKSGIRSGLVTQFEEKKQDFFVDQLGGQTIFNPLVDKVIKFSLNTLYSISPKTYQNNLNNYNNIQQYLDISPDDENSSPMSGENMKSIINDLMGQIKKWAEETNISSRLNK